MILYLQLQLEVTSDGFKQQETDSEGSWEQGEPLRLQQLQITLKYLTIYQVSNCSKLLFYHPTFIKSVNYYRFINHDLLQKQYYVPVQLTLMFMYCIYVCMFLLAFNYELKLQPLLPKGDLCLNNYNLSPSSKSYYDNQTGNHCK